MLPLIFRSFLPPVFLITLIKGAILFGFSTPSEAGAVGRLRGPSCSHGSTDG